jgi:diguanylate cyclase (GGDEF)-like protein
MLAPPTPSAESARLAALTRYDVLDTEAEESFDDIVRLASQICGVPMAAVSLVDADREFFKARVGIDVTESPRDISFCGHTILENDLLVVPDAAADTRFADNPQVVAGTRVRFYAGAPLITGDGHAVGALCVRDSVPHDLSTDQRDALRALGRQVVAQLELRRLLSESQDQAQTDALTGLGNRRRLFADVAYRLAHDSGFVLTLCDLDGFKHFNDTFGHPAGDALLVRMAADLADAVSDIGAAYRMGGDEFCTITTMDAGADRALNLVRGALSEVGQGFTIGCSAGFVLMPDEADSAEAGLQIADQRMYGEKNSGRTSATQQTREVLVRLLGECQPDLHDHSRVVGDLARIVAAELIADPDAQTEVVRAAELHDVGKVAVPTNLLNKGGKLNDAEWALMRTHTLVGERILSGASSMQNVARMVRSSHERWDGRGYPDGLAGEAIPMGARIVFVCDAYDAMTSNRPYRRGMPVAEALAEIKRCAGTQFDPRVAAAFCAALRSTLHGAMAA